MSSCNNFSEYTKSRLSVNLISYNFINNRLIIGVIRGGLPPQVFTEGAIVSFYLLDFLFTTECPFPQEFISDYTYRLSYIYYFTVVYNIIL